MPEIKTRNPSWRINDAFDHLRLNNFLLWISNFNYYADKLGAKKKFIDDNNITKAMSYWYISIKIVKYWNELDERNNHWNIDLKKAAYFDDTYTIKELWEALNESEGHQLYKIETIRRYVGEMCTTGLLRRAGNISSGRLQPSSYLIYAVGLTQKQWMYKYQSLSKAMSETLLNGNPKWDIFDSEGLKDRKSSYFGDDRAKAQFV